MKNLVVVDTTSALTHETIRGRPLGASEYQLYALVDELAAYMPVKVYNQRAAGKGAMIDGIVYGGLDDISLNRNSVVLVLRYYPSDYPAVEARIRDHPVYVWAQDVAGPWLVGGVGAQSVDSALVAAVAGRPNVRFVSPSRFNKDRIHEFFAAAGAPLSDDRCVVAFSALYDSEFTKADIVRNPRVLFYGSAWMKGVEAVVQLFAHIHAKDPAFKLVLANPGYDDAQRYESFLQEVNARFGDAVAVLGPLSRHDFSCVVKSALAVLTPRFAETFGCVFAESLALGTPVIADIHSGAVREFAGDGAVISYDVPDAVYRRLVELQEGGAAATVSLGDAFRLPAVVARWLELIASAVAPTPAPAT